MKQHVASEREAGWTLFLISSGSSSAEQELLLPAINSEQRNPGFWCLFPSGIPGQSPTFFLVSFLGKFGIESRFPGFQGLF